MLQQEFQMVLQPYSRETINRETRTADLCPFGP